MTNVKDFPGTESFFARIRIVIASVAEQGLFGRSRCEGPAPGVPYEIKRK